METNFNNFNSNNKFRNYIYKGISDYLNVWNIKRNIKKMVLIDKLPIELINKLYNYQLFEKEILNKYKTNSLPYLLIDNNKIYFSPYFKYGKYKIFGLFGIINIFGEKEVEKRIPIYKDMLIELENIPELEGDFNNKCKLYYDFNIKLKRKDSPTKDMFLLLTTRFMDEIQKLIDLNDEN